MPAPIDRLRRFRPTAVAMLGAVALVGTSLIAPPPAPTQATTTTTTFADGFESGTLAAWAVSTGGSGSASVESSVVRTGSYAAHFTAATKRNAFADARHTFASPIASATMGVDVYVGSEGLSHYNTPILRVFTGSGVQVFSLYRQNQDGNQVWWQDAGGAYHRTSALLPLRTWAHFDVTLTIAGGSSSTFQVAMNGTRVYDTTTAALGSSGLSTIQLGNQMKAEYLDLYVDNISVTAGSSPSPSPSPTATPTSTPSPTASATAAPTPTIAPAPTSTPTATIAPTSTPTATASATAPPTPTIAPAPTSTPSPTAAPTPTPVPSFNSDPSGQAMPVGDITVNGQAWHQVFTDDFTASVPVGSFPSAVSSKWNAYPDGWPDTTHNGTYECSQVCSEQNGLLNLYLHNSGGLNMVAAPVAKIPGADSSTWGDLLYGRYVMRFRADSLYGYKTAWLLWPESGVWPGDGEIDFPEGDLNGHICAYMHWMGATSASQQDAYCTSTTYSGWHTAVLEWLPNRVTFYLDGVMIGNSTAHIPSTPMHWVIQTETSTDGQVPAPSTAGNVQLDWVAVYRPS